LLIATRQGVALMLREDVPVLVTRYSLAIEIIANGVPEFGKILTQPLELLLALTVLFFLCHCAPCRFALELLLAVAFLFFLCLCEMCCDTLKFGFHSQEVFLEVGFPFFLAFNRVS